MQINNQNALITGASRGLGLALARRLANEHWQLMINARHRNQLTAAQISLSSLTNVKSVPGDVRDPAHRRALLEAAEEMGGLDLLVNNAGILGPSPQPSLLNYPLELLTEVFEVNVFAPLAVLQTLWGILKPGAVIINVTSDAAVEAYPGWGGYGSSKAALEQISAVLAVENPGWRIYWLDPGDMRTQMHQQAFPGEDISDRPLPQEVVPAILELIQSGLPSGRYKANQLIAQKAGSPAVF